MLLIEDRKSICNGVVVHISQCWCAWSIRIFRKVAERCGKLAITLQTRSVLLKEDLMCLMVSPHTCQSTCCCLWPILILSPNFLFSFLSWFCHFTLLAPFIRPFLKVCLENWFPLNPSLLSGLFPVSLQRVKGPRTKIPMRI